MLLLKRGRRIRVERKRADAPKLTASMRIALADLNFDELCVVYPGEQQYRLTKKVEVVPLAQMVNEQEWPSCAGTDRAQLRPRQFACYESGGRRNATRGIATDASFTPVAVKAVISTDRSSSRVEMKEVGQTAAAKLSEYCRQNDDACCSPFSCKVRNVGVSCVT